MNKLKYKALAFVKVFQNTYRDEEDRDSVNKIEFAENDLVEDFTAMLIAMNIFYEIVTKDEQDLVGFTHTLNRLAVQHLMESKKEEE